MEDRRPAMWRRPLALLIDTLACACLTFPVLLFSSFVYFAYFGHAMFGCACDDTAERYLTALYGSLALWPLPSLGYIVWSWSGLSGGRSLGMQAMRFRVVSDDERAS